MEFVNDSLAPRTFVEIMSGMCKKIDINRIIFLYNPRAEVGRYYPSGKSIVINLRRVPEMIAEYGFGLFTLKAALWASLIKVGLEKVRHAYQWQKLNAHLMGPKWADLDAERWSSHTLMGFCNMSQILWMPSICDMGIYSLILEGEEDTFFATNRAILSEILNEEGLKDIPEKLTFRDFFNISIDLRHTTSKVKRLLEIKYGDDLRMYKLQEDI